MSRIGRQPIPVASGVTVQVQGNHVTVKGPKGQLQRDLPEEIGVEQKDGSILVTRPDDQPRHRALHGLSRTLVANMVTGVSTGFTKVLEIQGVGYRVAQQGQVITLALGFSHPVEITPPQGISFGIEGNNRIRVEGIDKELVGQVAANIRAIRKPEPYKGKGIRYQGENVRRKAGKAGKGKGGKK
ncbi:MAG TPA: 50S ribosomal protein L6 [Dehalococcoidia bacterium]|nr:50S ribosomal protein L6 [Dehalococcoidia bacterium]